MNEFDDGRELDVLFCDLTHGGCREQREQGAQALTTGVHNVLPDVFDHVDV